MIFTHLNTTSDVIVYCEDTGNTLKNVYEIDTNTKIVKLYTQPLTIDQVLGEAHVYKAEYESITIILKEGGKYASKFILKGKK